MPKSDNQNNHNRTPFRLKRLPYATSSQAAAALPGVARLQPGDKELRMVAGYLSSGAPLAVSGGAAELAPGNQRNPDTPRRLPLQLLTDGVWAWDAAVAEMVKAGNIFLPTEFLEHVRSVGQVPEISSEALILLSSDYLDLCEPSASQRELLSKHEIWVHSKGQSGQKLISAGKLDLSYLNMAGLELAEADLSGCDLSGSCLADAHLSLADLSGAQLSHADLSRANLAKVVLDHALCTETVFAGADLSGASFFQTSCDGAVFLGANMTRCNAWRSSFDRADFRSCTLRQAFFENCSMQEARFQQAQASVTATFRAVELLPGQLLDGAAATAEIERRSQGP